MRQDQILPVLLDLIVRGVSETDNDFFPFALDLLGIVLFEYHHYGPALDSDTQDQFLETYIQLCSASNDDANVRLKLLFHFPAILRSVRKEAHVKLHATFLAFLSSESLLSPVIESESTFDEEHKKRRSSCRAIAVSMLPDVAQILGLEVTQELLQAPYFQILSLAAGAGASLEPTTTTTTTTTQQPQQHELDDDIVHRAILGLPDMMPLLLLGQQQQSSSSSSHSNFQWLEQVLEVLVQYNAKIPTHQWRRQLELLSQVFVHFTKWFTPSQIHDQVLPLVWDHVVTSARAYPVQRISLEIVLRYIRHFNVGAQRHLWLSKIRSELGRGDSASKRCLYLEAAHLSLVMNSQSYTQRVFMDTALDLVSDKVPIVRVKALLLLPKWKRLALAPTSAPAIEQEKKLDDVISNAQDMDSSSPPIQLKAAWTEVQEQLEVWRDDPDLAEYSHVETTEEYSKQQVEDQASMNSDHEHITSVAAGRNLDFKQFLDSNGSSSSSSGSSSGANASSSSSGTSTGVTRRTRVSSLEPKQLSKNNPARNVRSTSRHRTQLPSLQGSRAAQTGSLERVPSSSGGKTQPRTSLMKDSASSTKETVSRIPQISQPTRPSVPKSTVSPSNSSSGSKSSTSGLRTRKKRT